MKIVLLLYATLFGTYCGKIFAQTTPTAAVAAALQHHPRAQAAALDVQAKKYAEKTAFNLPNPEVNVESPTGEFYAVGILQSFEFPTVYTRQKQLAKAETGLAQAGQRVSENELRYAVRALYLENQVAADQNRRWAERDSLYQAIATTAARQFAAGEIDFLQKTLAENEAGKVHQERLAAAQKSDMLYRQLAVFTGLRDLGTLLPLQADTSQLVAVASAISNPSVAFEQQAAQVADQQLRLAKSQWLPNFSLGYLNQGARGTPIDYRFRASVGIPLWAGQYRAGAQTAQAASKAAHARTEAQNQVVSLEQQRAQTALLTALAQVRYHEQEALPRSQSLIAAALRLRNAGQIDYLTFLRTLDEAFAIPRDYAAQIQAFETARIQMLYLVGQ